MPFLQHLVIFASLLAGCFSVVPESMKDCAKAWESLVPTASAITAEDKLAKTKGHLVRLFAAGQVTSKSEPARSNRFSFWGLFVCENKALKQVACRLGEDADKELQLMIPVDRWYWNLGQKGYEGSDDFFAYACRNEGLTPTAGKWRSLVTDARRRGVKWETMQASDNQCQPAQESIWCGVTKEMLGCMDEWLHMTQKRRTYTVKNAAVLTMEKPRGWKLLAEFRCRAKKVVFEQCRIDGFDKAIPIGEYYWLSDYYYNCGQIANLAGDYSTAVSITISPVKGLKRQPSPSALDRLDRGMEGCEKEWSDLVANKGAPRESTMYAVQIVKALPKQDGSGFLHRSFWVEPICTRKRGDEYAKNPVYQLKQKLCEFGHRDTTVEIEPGRCKFFDGWTFRCGSFEMFGEVEKHVTVAKTTEGDKKECEPAEPVPEKFVSRRGSYSIEGIKAIDFIPSIESIE